MLFFIVASLGIGRAKKQLVRIHFAKSLDVRQRKITFKMLLYHKVTVDTINFTMPL